MTSGGSNAGCSRSDCRILMPHRKAPGRQRERLLIGRRKRKR
ncbi:hypothetical protein HMPREF1986_01869 [Oribacterium sp. oral taxon 078 str. F0263]|nr:hypothetical protein HMPREF1986_01869 [Oribacterium sp. oral taxon 078 str. F0263]